MRVSEREIIEEFFISKGLFFFIVRLWELFVGFEMSIGRG